MLMEQLDLPDARGHFGPYGGVFVAEDVASGKRGGRVVTPENFLVEPESRKRLGNPPHPPFSKGGLRGVSILNRCVEIATAKPPVVPLVQRGRYPERSFDLFNSLGARGLS